MTSAQVRPGTEERLDTTGGLKLFVRSWRPGANARGVVVIVPGFNSHSGYFGWTAEQLVAADLAVYAVDLRGRGQSDGERFYVEKFNDYVDDVSAVVKLAKSREPGLPAFLLGHSAGGRGRLPVRAGLPARADWPHLGKLRPRNPGTRLCPRGVLFNERHSQFRDDGRLRRR